MGYRLRMSLLSSSLSSPSGTGALSDSASFSTRGINDSIVWRHATVCWDNCKHHGRGSSEEVYHTSQWFNIAERPPATDLRGGNASEDSLTKSMANLVEAYAVDFQSDLFSSAAPGPVGDFGRLLWSLPGTDRFRLEMVSGSVLCEKVCSDGPSRMKSLTYRSTPDPEGSRD